MAIRVGQKLDESGAVLAHYYYATQDDDPPTPAPVEEVSPPGMKKMVKKMKKHRDIDNPFALAWHMKNKGYKSHYDSYVARHAELSEQKRPLTPLMSRNEHALAWRMLARFTEDQRDPAMVRVLRNRLLLDLEHTGD